jgi:cobalt-zinc-cadmium efflux system protein
VIHHHTTFSNLKIALILNLSFALIEVVGGLWTNSLAILADAIHDFGDATALGLALFFEYLAARNANRKYTYGYRRLSLASALLTGIFLIGASTIVIFKAIERLSSGQPDLPYLPGMLGFAVLGVGVNGYAAWRLMRGQTLNEKVVSWHLIEDVFGWIAVLVGTLGMMIFKIPQIDPVISLAFAAFMIWNVARQLIKTARLFLQATPEDINMDAIRKDILSLEGVEKIHDLHLWSLDGASHVLTAHIVVAQGTSPQACIEIKRQVRAHLDKGGSIHATIEIEWADETCTLVSPQCHLDDDKRPHSHNTNK